MVSVIRTRELQRAILRLSGWSFVLCWLIAHAGAASVTATVDRPVIALGETVTLSLTFDGVNINQPNLPALPNFQMVGRGSSLNMDITRGISQQTFTYQLAPTQIGDFVIPGFQLDTGGQALRTQPIPIKVVKPGDAVAAAGAAAPTAFVRVVVPKEQIYVGEVLEVEVHLYWLEGRPTQYPQMTVDSGFTVGKWLKPVESRAHVSNQLYNVVTFKQPIIPAKAGTLTLGPTMVPLAMQDKTRRPDFFGNRPEREVRLAADSKIIQVLPLPNQNVPATFAGAVGNFSMALTAMPTNLAAGDPITVRVRISGRGALDGVHLPPQPEWKEFKTYPATSQIEGADPNNTSGTKSFEQVVVPEREGIKFLPEFSFSFFDPELKNFRTLTRAPIPLQVGAATGTAAAMPSLPGASNAAPAQPTVDLAHIKPYPGNSAGGPPLITRPWFLGLQAVPIATWMALVAWRKRREKRENNPRLRRRIEVERTLKHGLEELRDCAARRDSDLFFATVSRLLQEQIGERLDVPSNTITESVVDERMRTAGAPEDLCESLHRLFHAVNVARYAPNKSSEELSAFIPNVEAALRALQKWEPFQK